MSNVLPMETVLPMVVYIALKYANISPRIKVSQLYGSKTLVGQWFAITIGDNPRALGNKGDIKEKDVRLAKDFVRLNRTVLVDGIAPSQKLKLKSLTPKGNNLPCVMVWRYL